MSSILNIVAVLLSVLMLLLVLPAFTVLFEVLAARRAKKIYSAATALSVPQTSAVGTDAGVTKSDRITVLMPAHNEEGGIAASLQSALSQMRPHDQLLVVADNCSDNTAALARAAGADVIERSDPNLRGKGYALDFGVQHLRQNPPSVVLILDADCLLEAGALALLRNHCLRLRRPVQACYLMSFPGGANDFGSRLAQFAFVVKNRVRPLGMAHLGMPCQLLGTGMAFPWEAISRVPLASGHIVEDMKLGVDLTAMGYPATFLQQALVTSAFPLSAEGGASQRKRWEHGHLQVLLTEVPRLLATALSKRHLPSLALALDLAVPPLALLTMIQVLAAALMFGYWLLSGATFPMLIAIAGLAALLLAVTLAWRHFGRDSISLATLAKAPLYALRKLPVYFGFISARQTAWVRSRRDHE